MDQPEYILVDELRTIVLNTQNAINDTNAKAAAEALLLPPTPIKINYQYGKVEEVNEMLQQYSGTLQFSAEKFPLFWVFTNFKIHRGNYKVYGEIKNLRMFIITGSDAADNTVVRIEKNFKPVLYPIYREFLKQLANSPIFAEVDTPESIDHDCQEYCFFTQDGQKTVFADVVDCLEISNMKIAITHNLNCSQDGL